MSRDIFWKFSEISKFSKISKIFKNMIFRKLLKFLWKSKNHVFEKFSEFSKISKIFENFDLNFLEFQNVVTFFVLIIFWWSFFLDRSGFSVRTRFFDQKVLEKSLEGIKRKMYLRIVRSTWNYKSSSRFPWTPPHIRCISVNLYGESFDNCCIFLVLMQNCIKLLKIACDGDL